MSLFSADGILLRRTEYGDHDLIITYFTHSMGRITVIAKNAKKSIKRFAGVLDPFSEMTIHCARQKRKNALPVLCSVDLDDSFSKIRTDAVKTGYASYWVELVNSWMEEGKTQTALYDLLHYVLEALNRGFIETEVLSLLFQIRFMRMAGFSPYIDGCGSCQSPLDDIGQERILFDLTQGRLVCNSCNPQLVNHGITVSKGTLKQLLWINTTDMGRAARIKFSQRALGEGERLLESFIPCHLGREVKSLMFLRRIRKPR